MNLGSCLPALPVAPVKSAFPVADKFLEVRDVGSVILSGIDYFVRSAGVFETGNEIKYLLGVFQLL